MDDVLIAGAGFSGSVLAIVLARRGLRVRLLEKACLPRYKACGGGVTAKTAACLPVDVRPACDFAAAGGELAFGGRSLFRLDLTPPCAWLAMRSTLDHFLALQAREAGAQVCEGMDVDRAEETRSGIRLRAGKEWFEARVAAAADGATSRLRGTLLPSVRPPLGMAMETEIEVPDESLQNQGAYATFDFGALPGGYGWIFPKNGHLSAGVFAAYTDARNLRPSLEVFLASHARLRGGRIQQMRMHPIPLGGSPHLLHSRHLLLLGDAAGLADPWLGEGMYYAARSALLAAEAVQGFLGGSLADLSSYTHQVNQELVRQLNFAGRMASWIFRFPRGASSLVARSPSLQNAVFGVVRGETSMESLYRTFSKNLLKIILESARHA